MPVRREDERLRPLAGLEQQQVLGGEGVQPAEPVRPGDPEDRPVPEVDRRGAPRQGALLGDRVAEVPHRAGVRPRLDEYGGHRVAHPAQRPKMAKCWTSVAKPCRSSSRATRGAATSGSASLIEPHSRHTRCRCPAASAGW